MEEGVTEEGEPKRKKGQRRKLEDVPVYELEVRFMNRIREMLTKLPADVRLRMLNWLRTASFDDSRGPAKLMPTDPRQLDNNVDGQGQDRQRTLGEAMRGQEDPFAP